MALLIQLPVDGSWEATHDGSSTWIPDTHVGEPDRVLSFQLWLGPAVVVIAI